MLIYLEIILGILNAAAAVLINMKIRIIYILHIRNLNHYISVFIWKIKFSLDRGKRKGVRDKKGGVYASFIRVSCNANFRS